MPAARIFGPIRKAQNMDVFAKDPVFAAFAVFGTGAANRADKPGKGDV